MNSKKTMMSGNPNSGQLWQQLAEQIEGKLVSSLLSSPKIEKRYREWVIVLDMTSNTGNPLGSLGATKILRVRAPFIRKDEMKFKVYRKTLWSKIGLCLGRQYVDTGAPEFDRDFIVRGNMKAQLVQLFQSPRIRGIIARQSEFFLEARGAGFLEGLPPNVNMLDYRTLALPKTVSNIQFLAELFDLFEAILDQLVLIGSAKKEAPKGIFD